MKLGMGIRGNVYIMNAPLFSLWNLDCGYYSEGNSKIMAKLFISSNFKKIQDTMITFIM